MKRLAIVALALVSCAAPTNHLTARPPHRSSFDGGRLLATVPQTTSTAVHASAARASRSETRPPQVVPAPDLRGSACPDVHEWHALVDCLPWNSGQAWAVVRCESGGRPEAYNASSGANGVFQILGGPSDPEANVRLAYSMWRSRGWQPWWPSSRCSGVR